MPPVPKPSRAKDATYLAYIRLLPCVCAQFSPCEGKVEVMHVIGKGAGGGDYTTAPGCAGHHRTFGKSFHRMGAKSFDRYYGIDLLATARQIRREYEETHPELEDEAA